MRGLCRLGEMACRQWDELRQAAAVVGTAVGLSVQPRCWVGPVRHHFARQVLKVGVEPVGFVCVLGVFVGMSVVVQLAFWTGKAGQSELLGPLLVVVVARELGPILANLVVIVRSSAMVTELGVLRARGEIPMPDPPGQDAFLHVVMPRVLGMALSALCLTVVLVLAALASGYLFGAWLGKGSRDLWFFTTSVLNALRPQDMVSIVAKSLLPALFTGASGCLAGLGVGGAMDIPRATQQALMRSTAGLFVISAVVSLLAYL